jgi:hypothetical protein
MGKELLAHRPGPIKYRSKLVVRFEKQAKKAFLYKLNQSTVLLKTKVEHTLSRNLCITVYLNLLHMPSINV